LEQSPLIKRQYIPKEKELKQAYIKKPVSITIFQMMEEMKEKERKTASALVDKQPYKSLKTDLNYN
jgi:hypothetical protein